MIKNLSPRQLEILALVAIGRTNDDIGQVLGISPRTAKQHVQEMLRRTESFNRCNMVWKALAAGILLPPVVGSDDAAHLVVPRVVKREIISESPPTVNVFTWRDVELSIERRSMSIGGVKAPRMRIGALKLIKHFLEHPNHIYSRAQLIDMCWGVNVFVEERVVDVYIRYARRTLGVYAKCLRTERGLGYVFEMPAA